MADAVSGRLAPTLAATETLGLGGVASSDSFIDPLTACGIAADLLRAAGFEIRQRSLQSESTYFGRPGVTGVVRISTHRHSHAGRRGVLANVTLRNEIGLTECRIIGRVAVAIGIYLLRASGAVETDHRRFCVGERGGTADAPDLNSGTMQVRVLPLAPNQPEIA